MPTGGPRTKQTKTKRLRKMLKNSQDFTKISTKHFHSFNYGDGVLASQLREREEEINPEIFDEDFWLTPEDLKEEEYTLAEHDWSYLWHD